MENDEINPGIDADTGSSDLHSTEICTREIYEFEKLVFNEKFILGFLFIINVFVLVYSGRFMFAISNFFILVYYWSNSIDNSHSSRKNEIKNDLARCVLITGCDSGFGYGTALQLNRENIYVFAGCLTSGGVLQLKDNSDFRGLAFIMDITNQDDIGNAKRMIENEAKEEGLWALVNNAGILQPGPIEWQSVKEMQNTMDVNLWGCVNVTKAMLPLVKKARGRIVNISSMAGRVLFPHSTSYSMSKYALEAFSDGLRYEMKPWQVSVHIIEPGMFKTNILDSSIIQQKWKDIWSIQPESILQEYGEEYYTTAVEMTKNLLEKLASPNVQKVVNKTCHAVTSGNPKLRYSVGYDANTLWMAIATLPTFIGDFIVRLVSQTLMPRAMKQS